MKKRVKKQEKKFTGKDFAKDMLILMGVGLAAGLTLVATADKVAKKAFSEYEDNVEFDD